MVCLSSVEVVAVDRRRQKVERMDRNFETCFATLSRHLTTTKYSHVWRFYSTDVRNLGTRGRSPQYLILEVQLAESASIICLSQSNIMPTTRSNAKASSSKAQLDDGLVDRSVDEETQAPDLDLEVRRLSPTFYKLTWSLCIIDEPLFLKYSFAHGSC